MQLRSLDLEQEDSLAVLEQLHGHSSCEQSLEVMTVLPLIGGGGAGFSFLPACHFVHFHPHCLFSVLSHCCCLVHKRQ